MPLLDGLDDVNPALRKACVDAINAYRGQQGLVPLVLCSRREEYLDAGVQILLQQAICIQPLTQQQIEEYLANCGEQSATLRSALHADTDLQKLVTTPLMLNILVQAYRDRAIEGFKDAGSLEMQRRQLFAVYVEHMLKRRKPGSRYSVQQSINWLAYLAREMKQHYQTEFYLERMQLDWLPTSRLQRLCQGLFIGLWAGLSGAVIIGGLFAWSLTGQGLGVIVIALFGLLSFLTIGFLSGFSSEILDVRLFVKPNEGIHRSAFFAVRNGLLAGLLNGLVLTVVDMFVTRFFPGLIIKSDFLFFSTLAFMLTITLGIGIHKGGEACIKHGLLRFMLWFGGQIPWNYPRFLDDAAQCLLLRKAGGGYTFVHHLLLDYFALLNEAPSGSPETAHHSWSRRPICHDAQRGSMRVFRPITKGKTTIRLD